MKKDSKITETKPEEFNHELDRKISLNLDALGEEEFGKNAYIPEELPHDPISQELKKENKANAKRWGSFARAKGEGKGKGKGKKGRKGDKGDKPKWVPKEDTKTAKEKLSGESKKATPDAASGSSSSDSSLSEESAKKKVEDELYARSTVSNTKFAQVAKFFQDAHYAMHSMATTNGDLVRWGQHLSDLGKQKAMRF